MASCPYLGSALVHVICGFVCAAAGVAFVLMLLLYPPLLVPDANGSGEASLLSIWQPWLSFLFANKIWCGFWFIITGVAGLSVRSRGSSERCYAALSALNALIWSTATMVLNGFFVYCIIFNFDLFGIQTAFEGQPLWFLVFPAIGLLFGFVEFITSIVSCAMTCCCSPVASRLMHGAADIYHLEPSSDPTWKASSRF